MPEADHDPHCLVARERDQLRALAEEALHICMHGEYAPGGTENWGDWCRKAETLLRGEEVPGEASQKR